MACFFQLNPPAGVDGFNFTVSETDDFTFIKNLSSYRNAAKRTGSVGKNEIAMRQKTI